MLLLKALWNSCVCIYFLGIMKGDTLNWGAQAPRRFLPSHEMKGMLLPAELPSQVAGTTHGHASSVSWLGCLLGPLTGTVVSPSD